MGLAKIFPKLRVACLVAGALGGGAGISAQVESTAPVGKIFLFSGTVAQSLTRTERGPANLVTTYYQAEGVWPLARWVDVEFEVEGGQIVGNNHAESLSASLGSAYRLNDLQEEPELFVPNFFLSGKQASGAFRWRLGRLGLQAAFDDNRVARNKRTKFLALPFTRNAAVPFPGKGLGAVAGWAPNPRAALTGGVGDANAVSTRNDLARLRGEWWTGGELTLRPLADPAAAALRVLAWRTTRRNVPDDAWAVSADAALAPGTVAFVRLGNGSEHFARTHGLVAGGFAWENPFGRKTDFAGLAFSRGVAVATGRRELLAEAVYRWQPVPWFALSPDVQWIRHPALARTRGPDAWAFGLRCAFSQAR